MTADDTGPAYLEEAAAELRKARDDNEIRARTAAAMHSGQREEAIAVLREVNARRMEIAAVLVAAEAVRKGLPPAYPVITREAASDA